MKIKSGFLENSLSDFCPQTQLISHYPPKSHEAWTVNSEWINAKDNSLLPQPTKPPSSNPRPILGDGDTPKRVGRGQVKSLKTAEFTVGNEIIKLSTLR